MGLVKSPVHLHSSPLTTSEEASPFCDVLSSQPSAALFKRLAILPIYMLYSYKIAILAFKLLSNPSSAADYGLPPLVLSSSTHSHFTRFSDAKTISFSSVTASNHYSHLAVSTNIVVTWNALPVGLRSCTKLSTFKAQLTAYLLDKL
eukprot:Pompholyxophrys_punicea_v1_NODE_960_length_1095_cov_15.703846.p2 type:complete len:147 gc:universal NODE_960_length_1095_cov_15.703846:578-1018(+)